MTPERLTLWLLYFVALYPPVTAAFWIAGGLLFRLYDEKDDIDVPPSDGWPGVTVLVPAYNEERVIEISIHSALAVEYPSVEVLVLDDGSTDETSSTARLAIGGDKRARVLRDPVNKGKAERLNEGFRTARHELVIVMDADTHIHPLAPKLLVSRMLRSPLNAAVAGAPHVTNRTNLLCAMQVMEAASIIGLIRRTGALRGRVGTVAGVLGLFRRDAVIAAGGYRGEMATEDIDLTWRLLLGGWQTTYEPQALVGMQVPPSFSALWKQRCRWARGQGETLHTHIPAIIRWGHRAMWPVAFESVASLLWVMAWLITLAVAIFDLFLPSWDTIFGLAMAWGIAIAIICMIQTIFAMAIDSRYDSLSLRVLFLGPLYPLFFWTISALAAIRAELPALLRGPKGERVVWDIPRDPADAGAG